MLLMELQQSLLGQLCPARNNHIHCLDTQQCKGWRKNLISHLTGAILGMHLTPGQGLHTLNHPPCCYLQYQSQERLSHELPGAVQTHQTAASMFPLEGNMPVEAHFQSEPRGMFSKPPLDTATGLLQRPQPNTPP